MRQAALKVLSFFLKALKYPFLVPSLRYKIICSRIFYIHPDEEIFKKALDFISHSGVEGDYLEFGVWKGRSFTRAYNMWKHLFSRKGMLSNMHFFAFDSFKGLPEVKDEDSSEFQKGQYYCSEESFKNNITGSGVDLKKVTIVPGWFDKVLNEKTKEGLSVRKAAIVFIDCDIYESTVPVLDFITDFVVDGTVIIFDDWFTFRGDPGRGEQRAFREWLTKHPSITAMEWQKVNWKTNSFIIHKR